MAREDYKDFVRTGPGTLAGRYLRLFWQPVYVAEELLPGRAVPIRIMSEDFTLYRGEDGTPHLVGFRCAHRGTQLSVGWVEDDCIRCFYHGWKYDGSGQCIEQPAEPEPFAHKVRIPSYPIRESIGLIFAYLGEGQPPPLPRYPNLEDPDSLLDVQVHTQDYNYFQNIENSVDFTHTDFVHRDRTDFDIFEDRPVVEAEESEWGITCSARLKDGRVKLSYFGMPNTNYVYALPNDPEIGRAELILWKVPIDDEHHATFVVQRIPVTGEAAQRYLERRRARQARQEAVPRAELIEAVLSGKMRVDDLDRERRDIIGLQDAIAQAAQGVIADRNQYRLGRSDVGVILLHKLWERELRALAEGRPLKQWRRPADMVPTKWLASAPA